MEHFSNGAILKSNISQMEQFSNGAFWGRHPMPYFKIPRTEKYGMQCARQDCQCLKIEDIFLALQVTFYFYAFLNYFLSEY